jgi:glucose uptake protein GlcU
VSAKLHSLTKLWLQRWLAGLWQCVQCGSAIVLKNVRSAKNKKHQVGLSVGSLVLSIFYFSVLSQWITFQFFYVVVCFLHLAVTVECKCRKGLRVIFSQVTQKVKAGYNLSHTSETLMAFTLC